MAEPFGLQGASTPQAVTAAQIDRLPIVAHFARRLGLVQIVNRLVSTQMEVEPGLIVLGLVLDTLSGRLTICTNPKRRAKWATVGR